MIEQAGSLLQNLPWGISIWAAILLSWGVYMSLLLKHIVQSYHAKDVNSIIHMNELPFMRAAHILMAIYLIFGPFITQYINDTFIVINIFYSTFLCSLSYRLVTWFKKKNSVITAFKVAHKNT